MKLSEYLDRHGLQQKDFAEKAELHPSLLNRILKGTQKPSFNALKRITDATNGKVTFRDFVEEE